MLVAVVTPYHRIDSEDLSQCIESVKNQTYKDVFHVVVGDGCRHIKIEESAYLHAVSVSHNIGDYGDSPRSIGAIYAFSQGADAVAFLDSDNWYESDHIQSLIELHARTGADVITSYRKLARLDGAILGVCPDSNSISFCDTNCMLFTKASAAVAVSWWTIPKAYHAIDDRVIWDRVLTNRHSFACTHNPSAIYRTGFRGHYYMFGENPPEGVKVGIAIGRLKETMHKLHVRAETLAPGLMIPNP